MRFDHNPTPPDFLGRRFQLRMLAMIGLLALVLVAIQFARRPSSWYWLTGRPRAAVPAADVGGQPVVHTPPRPRQEIAALVAIPPEELENIEDDSVGLRGEEIGPYHRILARARDLPQQDLDAMAGDAAFAVLQKQPDHFRGQLIAVAGDLRRLMQFPVRKNDEDITELFEALIFTSDSGTTPYRVRLTTRPVGLPFAESIDPPIAVRVVGYFFKRDQYIIEKDLRVHAAPLLLAQRIDRRFNTRPTTTTLPLLLSRWATVYGVLAPRCMRTIRSLRKEYACSRVNRSRCRRRDKRYNRRAAEQRAPHQQQQQPAPHPAVDEPATALDSAPFSVENAANTESCFSESSPQLGHGELWFANSMGRSRSNWWPHDLH